MECVYKKPSTLDPKGKNGFCPGCMYALLVKVISEVVEELDIREKVMLPMGVGCAVAARDWVDFDSMMGQHGRTSASALGFKRIQKDRVVIALQGDGDATSIGIAESIHTANRGEPITVIMVNNQIYGRTGGQMAPTTLINQKATTAVNGKEVEKAGYPLHLAELIATLKTPKYVARYSMHNAKEILRAKAAIKKAIETQMYDKKYSFIEILTACPTNLGMQPKKAAKYIEEVVLKEYQLGDFKSDN